MPGPSIQRQDEMLRPTVMDREEVKLTPALDLTRSYKGRNVIVTGANGTIGSEVVRLLLEAGAKVVVFGRESSKYSGKEGKNLFRYTIDFLVHPLDLESKFREAMKDLKGVLHSIIVCHGLALPGSVRTMNLKQWDRCMNVNVRSVFM